MFIRFWKANLVYDDDMTGSREEDFIFYVSLDSIMMFSDYKLVL